MAHYSQRIRLVDVCHRPGNLHLAGRNTAMLINYQIIASGSAGVIMGGTEIGPVKQAGN